MVITRRTILPFILFFSFVGTTYIARQIPALMLMSQLLLMAMNVTFVATHMDYFRTPLFRSAVRASIPAIVFFFAFFGIQVYHDQSVGNLITMLGYLINGIAIFVCLPFVLWSNPHYFIQLARFIVASALLVAVTVLFSLTGVGEGTIFSIKSQYQLGPFVATGGLLEHPIATGLYMNMAMVFAAILWFQTHRRIYLGLILLFFVACFLAQTRGALLSLFVGLNFFFLAPYIRSPQRLLTALAAVAVSVTTAIYLAFRLPVLSDIARAAGNVLSFRQLLWPFTLAQWLESPWLGIGLNELEARISEFDAAFLHQQLMDAHNTFLTMLTASGLPIAALYVLVFFLTLYRPILAPLAQPVRAMLLLFGSMVMVATFFQAYNLGGIRIMSLCMTVVLGFANQAYIFAKHPVWLDVKVLFTELNWRHQVRGAILSKGTPRYT